MYRGCGNRRFEAHWNNKGGRVKFCWGASKRLFMRDSILELKLQKKGGIHQEVEPAGEPIPGNGNRTSMS